MAKVKLSPPWDIYVEELEQMFKYDSEVHIVYDNEKYTVDIYVDDDLKAAALEELLPDKRIYGSVTLKITVIPANEKLAIAPDELFENAFKGNEVFSYTKVVSGIFPNNLTYVVFKKCVVQYFNDDFGDAFGMKSTLYQEIAKDIFENKDGVFYCTDIIEDYDFNCLEENRIGEWP